MNNEQFKFLVCPKTLGVLRYDKQNQELISEQAKLAYPIINDIPVMLEEQARDISTGS